jgi:predicted Rossmann-fold nucleotide-binding protein
MQSIHSDNAYCVRRTIYAAKALSVVVFPGGFGLHKGPTV